MMSGGDWRRGPQVDLPVRQWPARHHIRRTVSVADVLLVGRWQWHWWWWWWYINSKYQQLMTYLQSSDGSLFCVTNRCLLSIRSVCPPPHLGRYPEGKLLETSNSAEILPRCTCYWHNYFGRKVTGSRSQWQTEILGQRRLLIDWLSVWEARHAVGCHVT